MTKKIFQSILLVAGCVLLASLLIIMGFLYDYFGGVEENQLRDELSLAAAAVEDGGTDYLSQLTADRYRLTWIAADGSVLYDTKTDAESLENHASRAEVSQALAIGTGESTRYSSTLMEKTMYYAQRLDDGTVLRISISRATVGMIAVGMIQPLLIVLIVALILSGLLARRLSRRIVDPLNSLDLEHPLDNDAYEELSPLLKRIHHQHVEIQTQLRELREKTDGADLADRSGCFLVFARIVTLLQQLFHSVLIGSAVDKRQTAQRNQKQQQANRRDISQIGTTEANSDEQWHDSQNAEHCANDIQLRIAVFERLFTRFDHADNTVGGLKRLCFQELKLFRLARAADKGRGCARHQQEQHAKPDTGCHVFRDSEARHLTQARKQNQTDRRNHT